MGNTKLEKQLDEAKRKLLEAQDNYNKIAKKCDQDNDELVFRKTVEAYEGKYFKYRSAHAKFHEYYYVEKINGISCLSYGDIMACVTTCTSIQYVPQYGTHTVVVADDFPFTLNDLSEFEEITKQDFLDIFDSLQTDISRIRDNFN